MRTENGMDSWLKWYPQSIVVSLLAWLLITVILDFWWIYYWKGTQVCWWLSFPLIDFNYPDSVLQIQLVLTSIKVCMNMGLSPPWNISSDIWVSAFEIHAQIRGRGGQKVPALPFDLFFQCFVFFIYVWNFPWNPLNFTIYGSKTIGIWKKLHFPDFPRLF